MSSTHIPWHKHGTALGCGVLSTLVPGCTHYFVPLRHDAHLLELLVDLVVASAAGEHGCGLTNAGPLGGRASRAWWFDLATGNPVGSVIILGAEHADTLVRSVNAAAQARGVTTPLPIASVVARSKVVADIHAAKIQLHQAAGVIGQPVDLVVIDEPAAESLIRNAFPDAAIVLVCDYVPRERITDDTAIFESDGSTLFCVKSRKGTWAREFDLARVMMGGGEAFVIKPGGEAEFEQEWVKSNTAPLPVPPPKPVLPAPVPAKRVAVLPNGRRFSAAELAPWVNYDLVTHDSERAVREAGNVAPDEYGLVTIIPDDQDGRKQIAQGHARNARGAALTLGLDRRVRIEISDRTVRRWTA